MFERSMRHLRVGLLVVGSSCSLLPSAMAWQDKSVAEPLAGKEQITEGRVVSAITFLASDELAGRGTSTPEFNIAAAYVAARFRGAGLVGGGVGESFYHEKSTKMIQTPSSAATLQDESGKAIDKVDLLMAAESNLDFRGKIDWIDLKNLDENAKFEGLVGGNFSSDARGPRAVSQVIRLANTLAGRGAKALVLGIAADSPLREAAKQLQGAPRPESPQMQCSIPILLVGEDALASSTVSATCPAVVVTDSPMRNVIGILKGSDPELSKEAILFSAHLDHLGTRRGSGDVIYNGADDDATGVTAVLTLADAFAAMKTKPKRTLIFMTFWGEELGLLGSKHFVSEPTWPLDKIVANVNIEMIGRPEPGAHGKIWVTGWNESDLGAIMNNSTKPYGGEIFEHPKFSAMLYRSSDNWSFAEKGVIAHSFSAGSLHPDYHQPDDEWDRLEIPHMVKVIQSLFAASQSLADGTATPTRSASK